MEKNHLKVKLRFFFDIKNFDLSLLRRVYAHERERLALGLLHGHLRRADAVGQPALAVHLHHDRHHPGEVLVGPTARLGAPTLNTTRCSMACTNSSVSTLSKPTNAPLSKV